MGKARERRLRAMMRKADAQKKSSLLVKHYAETVVGGTPLLTEIEVFELQQSFESDDERKEYAIMLLAFKGLCDITEEAYVKHGKVMTMLLFLSNSFGRAKEYRNFENLLNELCLKRDGEYSKRLQERAVAIGRLVPYFYNIGLEENSGDQKCISLKLSDQELAFTKDVNEAFEQEVSEFKALTRFIRDLMKEYTTPIRSFTDTIENLEKNVQEGIRLTKRLLFNTDFELWEELRENLLKHSDPLLAMMEDLPDYEDIIFDEDLYQEKIRSLNKEFTNELKKVFGDEISKTGW
jgi:uncharacterized protein (UPF0262 family)